MNNFNFKKSTRKALGLTLALSMFGFAPHLGGAHAQTTTTPDRELVFDQADVRWVFATPAASAREVRVTVPPNAVDVRRPYFDGDGIRVLYEAPMTLREGFTYYDQLLERQGFTQAEAEAVEDDKIAAVYRRDDVAVGLTIESEGGNAPDRNFDVFFDFAPTAENRAATTAAPGTTPFYGYETDGVRYVLYDRDVPGELTADARTVRLGVPSNSRDVDLPGSDEASIAVMFENAADLRPVYEYYDRLLQQQGFERVAGNVLEDGTKIVAGYERTINGARNLVELNVEVEDRETRWKNYEVRLDLNPTE